MASRTSVPGRSTTSCCTDGASAGRSRRTRRRSGAATERGSSSVTVVHGSAQITTAAASGSPATPTTRPRSSCQLARPGRSAVPRPAAGPAGAASSSTSSENRPPSAEPTCQRPNVRASDRSTAASAGRPLRHRSLPVGHTAYQCRQRRMTEPVGQLGQTRPAEQPPPSLAVAAAPEAARPPSPAVAAPARAGPAGRRSPASAGPPRPRSSGSGLPAGRRGQPASSGRCRRRR